MRRCNQDGPKLHSSEGGYLVELKERNTKSMQYTGPPNLPQQRAGMDTSVETADRLFDLDLDLEVPNSKEEELYSAYCKLQKLFQGKSTLKITAEVQEKVVNSCN